jgi:hypothetical protein
VDNDEMDGAVKFMNGMMRITGWVMEKEKIDIRKQGVAVR